MTEVQQVIDFAEPGNASRLTMERTSEGETLRLVIVDHHQLFRDCLASSFGEGERFEVVGKVSSGQEALERLAQTRVDILLVALESSSDGICGLIREVDERYPASKVVLIGRDETEERVLD